MKNNLQSAADYTLDHFPKEIPPEGFEWRVIIVTEPEPDKLNYYGRWVLEKRK